MCQCPTQSSRPRCARLGFSRRLGLILYAIPGFVLRKDTQGRCSVLSAAAFLDAWRYCMYSSWVADVEAATTLVTSRQETIRACEYCIIIAYLRYHNALDDSSFTCLGWIEASNHAKEQPQSTHLVVSGNRSFYAIAFRTLLFSLFSLRGPKSRCIAFGMVQYPRGTYVVMQTTHELSTN